MSTTGKTLTHQLLFNRAKSMGLSPRWLSGHLFSVTTPDGFKYVFDTISSLNSHISTRLVRDKFLCRSILGQHGLPNIPFAKAATVTEAKAFFGQYQPIIAKPLAGMGARDIHLITDAAELGKLKVKKYIFEKYISGKEMRYLILNDEVIAVHESDYGTSVDEMRPLERISYHREQWNPGLMATSRQIAAIFGLRFSCIDYIIEANGKVNILEVNSAPGLKWFHSPTRGPAIDVAQMFLDAVLAQSDNAQSPLATAL